MTVERVIVCRCQEITLDQVREAIADGAVTVDAVKRRTTAGMGLCQGKTCGKLVAGIIARETGIPIDQVQMGNTRPPARPIRVGMLADLESKLPDYDLDMPAAVRCERKEPMEPICSECDVLVVGAGAIGSSIAYNLAARGRDVVLAEAGPDFAVGTSGATQAWVWVSGRIPVDYHLLAKSSAEIYAGLSDELEYDLEYRVLGGMIGYLDREEMEKARVVSAEHSEYMMFGNVLSGSEARSMEPALGPKVVGASYGPLDGTVNPFRLVHGYLRTGRKHGLRTYTGTDVLGLEAQRDLWSVLTSRGQIECRSLVIAAGVRTAEVAGHAGIEVPVQRMRGQVLVTEQLPPVVNHVHHGVRQDPTGQLLLGYIREKEGLPNRNNLAMMATVARIAVDYMPFLADVEVIRSYSGVRPWPVDTYPIVGRVQQNPSMYVAVTHSGITMAPILGRLMADSVISGREHPRLEPYRPGRFDGCVTE